MSPAAKRGPPTSGLSPHNWRSTPASHRPADVSSALGRLTPIVPCNSPAQARRKGSPVEVTRMRHRVSEVNHLLRCCRACKLLVLRPSPLQEGCAGALNFVSDHFQCSSLVLEQLREPQEIGVERQPNAESIFGHFLFLIPIRELAGSPTAARGNACCESRSPQQPLQTDRLDLRHAHANGDS